MPEPWARKWYLIQYYTIGLEYTQESMAIVCTTGKTLTRGHISIKMNVDEMLLAAKDILKSSLEQNSSEFSTKGLNQAKNIVGMKLHG